MIQYEQIKNSLKQIILKRDGTLLPRNIVATASLKHDLNMDSLDILETVMDFENEYKIFIQDTSEIEKASNLGEFAQALYDHVNHNNPKKMSVNELVALTKEDIFKIIEKHFYEKYNIPYAKPESNIYKDFGFTEFDKSELFDWIEKQFQIKLPLFYYSSLDIICQRIHLEIRGKAEKYAFRNKLKKIFTRSK